ncbi:hypothetical protein [Cupriavidus necator]
MTLLEFFESRPELLDMLRQRQVTNRQVAAQAGVSEEHLARVLTKMGVRKVRGEVVARRAEVRTLAEERQKHRQDLAKSVLAGKRTIEDAAALAGCSERTLYRYIQKALTAQADRN